MRPSARHLRDAACGLALVVLPGCALLTDQEERTDARVEVADPTVVRTIHYHAADGRPHDPESEITALSIGEIDCLHMSPRRCWLSETLEATVHNTGTRTLYWHGCDSPLERYALGTWLSVRGVPYCTLGGIRPLEIAPGEHHALPVDVVDVPAGEYRVRFDLYDGREKLLDEQRTSPPFHLQPPPDVVPFACPTTSRVERATRFGREELERAAQGIPTQSGEGITLRLESQVPGIGGLFNVNDVLHVWITDETRAAAAATVVQEALGRTPRVLKGDYAFSELVGWKEILIGYVVRVPGWRSLDADERLNRVSVEVATELDRAQVECIGDGIGMPPGMLVVVVP